MILVVPLRCQLYLLAKVHSALGLKGLPFLNFLVGFLQTTEIVGYELNTHCAMRKWLLIAQPLQSLLFFDYMFISKLTRIMK